MPYIPHTPEDIQHMLTTIGVNSPEELFNAIPDSIRLKEDLKLPQGLSEYEVFSKVKQIATKNNSLNNFISFLGAGCYNHFVPIAVKHIITRSEFYTAYTPYQPEASQGTLQAIFEYQTFICLLTGIDVTCASLYEGASSLAEAILMAYRIRSRPKILLPANLHPEYKQTIYTYLENLEFLQIIEIPYTEEGTINLDILKKEIDSDTCSVIVSLPNFFGIIEDLNTVSKICKDNSSIFIVSCNPIALSIFKPPAEFGADIVCGDGQVLGQGLFLGGFTFGFLATRTQYVRKMPGRIVGETTDKKGKKGFVLTLQAREQHIRRQKATSNICSNQSLNVIACATYLSLLGPEGFKKIGLLSTNAAHFLYEKLHGIKGLKFPFTGNFFNEFAITLPYNVNEICSKLREKKILAGVPIEKFFPQLKNTLLVATTELTSRRDIEYFVSSLNEVLR